MQRKGVAKFLLTGMVALLVVPQTRSSIVGLNRACIKKNGTICNRRPPEDCNFEKPQPSPGRQRLAIDPETLFHAALFVNHSSPIRQLYLFLQWMQYGSFQSDYIMVRVTPLLQGIILDSQVMCMSNQGHNNETNSQIHLSDSTNNISRQATIVPLPGNVTAAIVEISINSHIWEYMVQIPTFSRNSWILQGVSVTAQGNKGYISITSPDSLPRNSVNTYNIVYYVTLVCHLYNQTEHNETDDKRSMKILSRSAVTNCSNTNREMYMQYLPQSSKPLVFPMTGLAYSIVVDAQLLAGSSNQAIGETYVTTPIFVHVGATDDVHSTVTQKPRLADSTEQDINGHNKITASELSAFPPKSSESGTDGSSKLTWGIAAGCVSLALVVCLFVAWRLTSWKCRTNGKQRQGTSDKSKFDNTKRASNTPSNTADNLDEGSRKLLRFQSEYCTNGVSDVPPSVDLSDSPMVHSGTPEDLLNPKYKLLHSQLPNYTILDSNEKLYYDVMGRHLAPKSFYENRDDADQGRDSHHLLGLASRKQIPVALSDAMYDRKDTANNEPQTNMDRLGVHSKPRHISRLPLKQTHFYNSSLPRLTDFKYGSNFKLDSRENSVWEEDDSDYEYFGQDVVKPELFSDHIDPRIMKAECCEINHEYEQLTGIASGLHYSPSYDTVLEDECFSISETIIC